MLRDLATETALGARELARRGAPQALLKKLAARGWVEPCELAEVPPVPSAAARCAMPAAC